jgi:hypothetical protein
VTYGIISRLAKGKSMPANNLLYESLLEKLDANSLEPIMEIGNIDNVIIESEIKKSLFLTYKSYSSNLLIL